MMTSQPRSTLRSLESVSGHRERKDRHRSPNEPRHHRRRRSTIGETERLQSSRLGVSESGRGGRENESSESEEDAATQSGSIEAKPARRKKTRVIYVTERDSRSSRWKERSTVEAREQRDDTRHNGDSPRRSRDHQTRRASVIGAVSISPPKRSASARRTADPSPKVKRSNTTTATAKPPTVASTNANSKRPSFLGNIFGPAPPHHREPEKLVECLTCLSDDIPRSKAAKLKCGHRMCNSCLRRIFKLSINDPQHMPPKCCTTDYIPLKHVDKLFDVNFKKTWNRKFQEYSTKNRIYCPSRRCGEWIKPADIHKEEGRKYGKCSRCKTKVCCLCNGKWHGSKDCPKDEETNQLLEAAKQAGWQRCYSCKAMVELKEGCNHMTCRCKAQFCMVCGDKWKTCDCPWFNYTDGGEEQIIRMRLGGRIAADEPLRAIHRLPLLAPVFQGPDYLDHLYRRRRHNRGEEEILGRFGAITLEDNGRGRGDGDGGHGGVDFRQRIAEVYGVGNGAGHLMNDNYIQEHDDDAAPNIDQATAAANHAMGVTRGRDSASGGAQRRQIYRPVPLRRHTLREEVYNSAPSTRPSERVVPRRVRRDYESEASVHAPHQRPASTDEHPAPSTSALAGLRGNGKGSNRVSAWRRHVEPGVEPAEGVLSM